jgi:hypothetical protein
MLVVLVVGGSLGWICYRARVQREAVAAIERAGGEVKFDWQARPPGRPGWLRRQVGPGFFEEVIEVAVLEPDDSLMVHVGRLRHLQWLGIWGGNATDSGLAAIAGLTDLRELYLSNTRMTDAGLAHLAGLRKCKEITVTSTKVTPAGIAAMKHKCPWMTIVD